MTDQRKHVIVYGPPATGKTTNKRAIARSFGIHSIIDGLEEGTHPQIAERSLILTTSSPHSLARRFPKATLVPINTALRRIGGNSRRDRH